ncbi:hypothetical protein EGH24_08070 [Halonotius terrestris]|uniref:Uncharacterized protein n=1 Tax=Halonotius terrestris TaxID=2487750 RepID=A0A8J8PBP8_9EURY|nr:DUF5813 family protein [Halonotius terrestris]TQQ81087.1 hypothetical protein EGH24_08070 [Halonotius terrestris]
MSDLPERFRRAFERHTSFEARDDGSFESVTTAFDGVVDAEPTGDSEVRFSITVTVPLLGSVTEDEMADIVEDGWYETFELRVTDVGKIFRTTRELSPTVRREGDDVVVEAAFADSNADRGVDDAGALIDFVEGTYVQGIIPGYEYTEPVASIIDQARQTAGSN